jgi:hypothetical protein
VTTHDDPAVAAGHSVDPGRWLGILDELMLLVGARFRRVEPRRRARAFVLVLLAGQPRVNCWSIAEHAGDASPAAMQHLLSRACWDAEGCVMTFAAMSCSIWVIRTGCWWWMRPGM